MSFLLSWGLAENNAERKTQNAKHKTQNAKRKTNLIDISWTEGHFQIHYLPALSCFMVYNKPLF